MTNAPGQGIRSGSRFPARCTCLALLAALSLLALLPLLALFAALTLLALALLSLLPAALAVLLLFHALAFAQGPVHQPLLFGDHVGQLGQGLVHRLASNNTYLACAHPQAQHEGLFLVCSSCGHTQEVHTQGMVKKARQHASDFGFQVEHAVVEVAGMCTQCQGQQHE